MVDMTVLEAVAVRCRSSSLLLGTIEKFLSKIPLYELVEGDFGN
jgi:hypothetical protein